MFVLRDTLLSIGVSIKYNSVGEAKDKKKKGEGSRKLEDEKKKNTIWRERKKAPS